MPYTDRMFSGLKMGAETSQEFGKVANLTKCFCKKKNTVCVDQRFFYFYLPRQYYHKSDRERSLNNTHFINKTHLQNLVVC